MTGIGGNRVEHVIVEVRQIGAVEIEGKTFEPPERRRDLPAVDFVLEARSPGGAALASVTVPPGGSEPAPPSVAEGRNESVTLRATAGSSCSSPR